MRNTETLPPRKDTRMTPYTHLKEALHNARLFTAKGQDQPHPLYGVLVIPREGRCVATNRYRIAETWFEPAPDGPEPFILHRDAVKTLLNAWPKRCGARSIEVDGYPDSPIVEVTFGPGNSIKVRAATGEYPDVDKILTVWKPATTDSPDHTFLAARQLGWLGKLRPICYAGTGKPLVTDDPLKIELPEHGPTKNGSQYGKPIRVLWDGGQAQIVPMRTKPIPDAQTWHDGFTFTDRITQLTTNHKENK
jgi:hypothetical protein